MPTFSGVRRDFSEGRRAGGLQPGALLLRGRGGTVASERKGADSGVMFLTAGEERRSGKKESRSKWSGSKEGRTEKKNPAGQPSRGERGHGRGIRWLSSAPCQ